LVGRGFNLGFGKKGKELLFQEFWSLVVEGIPNWFGLRILAKIICWGKVGALKGLGVGLKILRDLEFKLFGREF